MILPAIIMPTSHIILFVVFLVLLYKWEQNQRYSKIKTIVPTIFNKDTQKERYPGSKVKMMEENAEKKVSGLVDNIEKKMNKRGKEKC